MGSLMIFLIPLGLINSEHTTKHHYYMWNRQEWKETCSIQDHTCKAFAVASATRSYFLFGYQQDTRCNSSKNGDSHNHSRMRICGTKTSPLGADRRGNMVLTAVLAIRSQPLTISLPLTLAGTMVISSLRSFHSNQSYNSQGVCKRLGENCQTVEEPLRDKDGRNGRGRFGGHQQSNVPRERTSLDQRQKVREVVCVTLRSVPVGADERRTRGRTVTSWKDRTVWQVRRQGTWILQNEYKMSWLLVITVTKILAINNPREAGFILAHVSEGSIHGDFAPYSWQNMTVAVCGWSSITGKQEAEREEGNTGRSPGGIQPARTCPQWTSFN